MKVYTGIAVSPGVVSGPVLVLGSENFRIPRKYVSRDAIDDELHRFHAALEHVCRDIKNNEQVVSAQLSPIRSHLFCAFADGSGSATDS